MEFRDNQERFLDELEDSTASDWAFIEQSKNLKIKSPAQNMLLSLSNNLIAYENSYKKAKNTLKIDHQSLQHCKKRKILKRKLNFSTDLPKNQPFQSGSETDKQNRIQTSNLNVKKTLASKDQISKTKRSQKDDSGSNLIKLQKMFKIMKEFNTLNETILPFKVNLNKVSHKRILANMAFKQFSLQNTKDDNLSNGMIKTENEEKKTLENCNLEAEFIPIKRRVQSFDTRVKESLNKRKIQSNSISNQVFTINHEDLLEVQRKERPFSRRKRSYSVRKPENYIVQKSIEEIRQNYSRAEKNPQIHYFKGSSPATDMKGKDYDKFSDSKFFIKRQKHYEKKREGLSEISVSGLINFIKK